MKRILSILIVLLLITSAGAYILSPDWFSNGQDDDNDDDDATKIADEDDIEDLKTIIGEKDPNKDYNVIINNNGTGLAPPSQEQWDDLVGVLSIATGSQPSSNFIPSSMDLSKEPYFPPVKNQGSQGSCSAWASTYYAYGYMLARYNNWTDTHTGNPKHLISPTWTYNKVNGGVDQGSCPLDNFLAIRNFGAASFDTMRPDPRDSTSWGSSAAWREAYLHSNVSIFFGFVADDNLQFIKELLASKIPVVFGIDAGQYPRLMRLGLDNTLTANEYNSATKNHANTIVGYDDNLTIGTEKGAFLVVNSWGKLFGDKGFYWLTYDALKKIEPGSTQITYVKKLLDRNTSLLATLHFNPIPSNDLHFISITDGWGKMVLPQKSWMIHGNGKSLLPRFMCLDISSLRNVVTPSGDFHLTHGNSTIKGTVESFHIEVYDSSYYPGHASQISNRSVVVENDRFSLYRVEFQSYSPISLEMVLQGNQGNTTIRSGGIARWVGIPMAEDGRCAIRSGDIADSQSSWISLSLRGPGLVKFEWKVSSEEGKDLLNFYIDNRMMKSITGQSEWIEEAYPISAGVHTLNWTYTKNSIGLVGDDCASISSISWNGEAYYEFDHRTINGDQEIEITRYYGTGGSVTIPAELNGKPVTSIGEEAFSHSTVLTSVTIPNSVRTIGNGAFLDCIALKSVTIPSSVTTIGAYAFSGCSSLTSVILPSNVTTIGSLAFTYCTSLTSFNVAVGNTNYASVDGVLYNKAITTLIQYPGGKKGAFIIPNNITAVGRYSFFYCTSLTAITIPSTVTSIGDYAFQLCKGLSSVIIPRNVEVIGSDAFSNCTSLTSITFHGMIAPATVGQNWIAGTPSALRGHAYATSNFPAPGGVWNGLTMGTVIP